jgi:hypothetical protein
VTRRARTLLLTAALTASAIVAPSVGLPGRVPSVAYAEDEVNLSTTRGGWAQTGALPTDAAVVGLTWDAGSDLPERVELRTRDGRESWSGWEEVELDRSHAPDPGTPEFQGARDGTSPIIIGGADEVQFRVQGDEPSGLRLAQVTETGSSWAGQPRTQAHAAVVRPAINNRAAWGADRCVTRSPADPSYTTVKVMFVHHTAGSSTYAKGDVAGIIAGICSYHVNGRGWSDIGYNALVDRFGGIWEGRYGGIDQGVVGAHTGGFNSYSTGVAFLGEHENSAPSTEAAKALVTYGAWKLGVHGIDPQGSTALTSAGSSKYSAGTKVTMNNVSGHRDASATACPGKACYSLLPQVRADIARAGTLRISDNRVDRTLSRLDGRAWEPVTFSATLSEPSDWTVTFRDESARAVGSTAGRGTAVRVTWQGASGGPVARRGAYTAALSAARVDNGVTAAATSGPFQLGGPRYTYSDLRGYEQFAGPITWMGRRGITSSCSPPHADRFCPAAQVTRRQMSAFLQRGLALPNGDASRFTDVAKDDHFRGAIGALAKAGITRGCTRDGTKFCPKDVVTREQMASFLVRALKLPPAASRTFTDIDSSPHQDAIAAIAQAGITTGCNPPSNTKFCPRSPVTRAQMAAFLHRALADR